MSIGNLDTYILIYCSTKSGKGNFGKYGKSNVILQYITQPNPS